MYAQHPRVEVIGRAVLRGLGSERGGRPRRLAGRRRGRSKVGSWWFSEEDRIGVEVEDGGVTCELEESELRRHVPPL